MPVATLRTRLVVCNDRGSRRMAGRGASYTGDWFMNTPHDYRHGRAKDTIVVAVTLR